MILFIMVIKMIINHVHLHKQMTKNKKKTIYNRFYDK